MSFNDQNSGAFTGRETQDIPPYLPPEPERFGGWLVLPLIGLCLSPFLIIYGVVSEIQLVLAPNTDETEQVFPGTKALVYSEIFLNSALLAFTIFVLVQFWRKKSIVPTLMIYLFASRALLAIADALAVHFVFHNQLDSANARALGQITGAAIVAAIWITYFLKSQRVAATFTRP